jgi:hypothetical protein
MSTVTLRFLADEGCDFGVVRALRAAGYDVFAVCEVMTRSDDRQLIEQAGWSGASCSRKIRILAGWSSSAMLTRRALF